MPIHPYAAAWLEIVQVIEEEPFAFEAREGFVQLRDGDEECNHFPGYFGCEKH